MTATMGQVTAPEERWTSWFLAPSRRTASAREITTAASRTWGGNSPQPETQPDRKTLAVLAVTPVRTQPRRSGSS